MSLSNKKYCFIRKKTENKENSFNTEVYLESINDNNKNNLTTINPEISLNDLICQTNNSEKLNKELINSNFLSESQIKDEINDIKNEDKDLANNSKLLYLIHQNKSENIDFISTLLKLKGIKTYSFNNDNSSKNIISQKYEDKNNSTLSKANTISENYHRNNNEEEVLKKINNSIYSINDINYNLESSNKTFNKHIITNINMMKIDQNIFQKERMTIDFEKENNNFFLHHTNKDTISSIECNTNNSTKKNIRKNDIELINTRECCLNITIPENYNKTHRRKLIPIKKNNNYKTLYKSNNISRKNTINYSKEKSINKKKTIMDVFKEKKIFNKKSSKRMNHVLGINNTSINSSKERQLKNHYSQINEINLKISENPKKNYSKKNNIVKNKISLNKKMSNKRNISFIKKNNKNDIMNKSTNYIFPKNNKIFHENHYKPKINEINNDKIKKTTIFDKKVKKEKIKQILKKELLNNPKQIKKTNTKNIINKNLNKNNTLRDLLPHNTERKEKSKIFKIRSTHSDKFKISLSKSNNFSSYINSKNEDHKFESKNFTLSNVNSYKKISKPKNRITLLFRSKKKKFPIRTNLFNESFFKYNKFNISFNNSSMSINSIKNKSLGLNNTINKKKKIVNISNKNNNKVNTIKKHKNQGKLMNELKGEKKPNLKEKLNNEDITITKKENNHNEIQEIRILNINEIGQNNSVYEKENNIKRAEIFLFDNNEQIQSNNNEKKQE